MKIEIEDKRLKTAIVKIRRRNGKAFITLPVEVEHSLNGASHLKLRTKPSENKDSFVMVGEAAQWWEIESEEEEKRRVAKFVEIYKPRQINRSISPYLDFKNRVDCLSDVNIRAYAASVIESKVFILTTLKPLDLSPAAFILVEFERTGVLPEREDFWLWYASMARYNPCPTPLHIVDRQLVFEKE